jgi:hypothetical protein
MTWLYSVWFAYRRIILGYAVVGVPGLVLVTAVAQGEYRVMLLALIWLSLGVRTLKGQRSAAGL